MPAWHGLQTLEGFGTRPNPKICRARRLCILWRLAVRYVPAWQGLQTLWVVCDSPRVPSSCQARRPGTRSRRFVGSPSTGGTRRAGHGTLSVIYVTRPRPVLTRSAALDEIRRFDPGGPLAGARRAQATVLFADDLPLEQVLHVAVSAVFRC